MIRTISEAFEITRDRKISCSSTEFQYPNNRIEYRYSARCSLVGA